MAETNYVPNTKRAQAHLGSVLVLGLGKSGTAAAQYCANLLGTRVSALAVAAGKESPQARTFVEQLRAQGVKAEFDWETFEDRYDVCIASPGISQFSDFYRNAAAASGEVISEIEFAWRESAADSRWVAVTGTNGKTTTTSLIAHVLQQAGLDAQAVGNIGDVCLEAVAHNPAAVYVAEVSSYQLASTKHFAPNVAILLNVTPDHLTWHGSMEEYERAKLKAFANLANVPGAVAVLDATDDVTRGTVRAFKAQGSTAQRGFAYIPVGTAAGLRESMIARCGSENAAYVDAEERLHVEFAGTDHALCAVGDLQIAGDHNVSNALAAASAAVALGAADDAISAGLQTFAPLEHRIEPCGSILGVACYNDSKATNVDATLKAFAAFPPRTAVVLLGGHDKHTDLAPLVQAANENAKAVVCFGAAGERFAQAFVDAQAHIPVLRAPWLEDALDAALGVASPGDVVVLSPACASFDEFNSFEHRGEVFKQYVAARMAQQE
ncbi:MAG: UDP-N-acetylmuramoyl-L-alanine--D-glutamate ligase [Coriobacteriia bacterium]|nr:UDP-N-acetylmuramoyl-L-alanine--D-glutamate ligase [Coriobacteriia bacterium]